MVLILKSTLWFFFSLTAQSQPLDQDGHHRFIAAYDGYHRSSLEVRTIKAWDQVEFSVCNDGKCTPFPETVSLEQIASRQPELLASLREYREELKNRKYGFWASISGNVGQKKDLEAMDQLIAEIEKDGLRNWVLLTKQNIQQDPRSFGTDEAAHGFYDRVKSVLLKTPPTAAEIHHMERALQKLDPSKKLRCE
ncbi:MAG: hypothetical protein KF789_10400 [Bdellovibrionaceae bacterium]|nr:hypothetical protein [Pseudobdellovibrionaceae bacterium]